MKLAWARLGIPLDIINWLTSLDQGGHTYPWTPHMADNIEPQFCDDLLQSDGHFVQQTDLMGVRKQRGINQGDTMSAVAWVTIFDILLTCDFWCANEGRSHFSNVCLHWS
jgi:hypothetical protein